MRVLSIIGIIVFSILGYLFVVGYAEIEPFINDLNSIGELASIFDAGENISDFTESIDAVFGLSFIACIFGFILSIVGCFAPGKKIVYVERVKEVTSQQ